MNDSFEKLYQAEEEDIGYYQDAAMEYLSELEELKDQLKDCHERVKLNQLVTKEQQDFLKRRIVNLENELEIRQEKLRAYNLLKIEKQLNAFTNQIRMDVNRYNKTGRFDTIDNCINEVRDLFNIFLAELNNLNSKNRDVLRVLETLIRLDKCEKVLRKAKREITKNNVPSKVLSSTLLFESQIVH